MGKGPYDMEGGEDTGVGKRVLIGLRDDGFSIKLTPTKEV
jgi:hypothetical protein